MTKKAVTFRIDSSLVKKLKYIALDHDKTLTELFLEGIQHIIRKYEKKPIK